MTPNENAAPLEIGWPPIDLNDAAPPAADPRSRPGSLAVAFVGGLLLGSVRLLLIPVAAMEYYREHEKHARWSAFLGAGVLAGLVALLTAIIRAGK